MAAGVRTVMASGACFAMRPEITGARAFRRQSTVETIRALLSDEPADPAKPESVEYDLYNGMPGVVLFYLELYHRTGGASWLTHARAGIFRERDDRIAGDARQDRAAQRRCRQWFGARGMPRHPLGHPPRIVEVRQQCIQPVGGHVDVGGADALQDSQGIAAAKCTACCPVPLPTSSTLRLACSAIAASRATVPDGARGRARIVQKQPEHG